MMQINDLSERVLRDTYYQCCSSTTWVERMLANSPITDVEHLLKCADECWLGLKDEDYLESFAGHPKIGDLESMKEKYAETKIRAKSEQSGMDEAADETIKMLAIGNRAYEKKFEFIFIICATGKSAKEMLASLQTRLVNDRETEIKNAAEQQRLIFHIRLKQLK